MAAAMRVCARCERNRNVEKFFKPRGRVCLPCQRASTKQRSHGKHVHETYGLTAEQYKALFQAQDGRCAICRGTRRENLSVDHDHKRLVVRGLLCRMCNGRLLTAAKDNPEILRRAADYLEHPPAIPVVGEIATPAPEPGVAVRRTRRGGGPGRADRAA